MKDLKQHWSAPAALVTLIFAAFTTATPVSVSTADETDLKPHSLYMQRLREHLSNSHVSIPDSHGQSDSMQGRLVATSIETQSSGGRGNSENGFSFQETNKMELEFLIPKQNLTGGGPPVELWVFPDKSSLTSRSRLLRLSFLAMANIPQAYNPRSDQSSFLWDTNQDCISINMTNLSKKISKVLQKRNLNESNVVLTLEITRVEEITDADIANTTLDALHRDICSSMQQRQSNDSFLVIKSYDDQEVFAERPPAYSVQKREAPEVPSNATEEGTDKEEHGCSVVPLVVNLKEVYGSFIKAPVVTDIRDCSGRCTLLHDGSKFSKHGEVKERLKFLPGGESFASYQPSCMPIRFRPLHMLIKLQSKSYVIVQMLDLWVEECACQ